MIVKASEVQVGDYIWMDDPWVLTTTNPPAPLAYQAKVKRVEIRPNGFIALWTGSTDPGIAYGPETRLNIERP